MISSSSHFCLLIIFYERQVPRETIMLLECLYNNWMKYVSFLVISHSLPSVDCLTKCEEKCDDDDALFYYDY